MSPQPIKVQLSAHHILQETFPGTRLLVRDGLADVVSAIVQEAITDDFIGRITGLRTLPVLDEKALLGVELVGAIVHIAVQCVARQGYDDALAQIDLRHTHNATSKQDEGENDVLHVGGQKPFLFHKWIVFG